METNYKIRHLSLLLIMAVVLLASACKTEKVLPQKEALKDISGNWQVIKATRNGTDLTAIVDFSQFRLNFTNGNYTLQNKLPFLVDQNGSFSLDDPQYPYKITFIATGKQPVSTAFTYPIVNGKRQLSLTFSPGCANNSYIYVLQQVN
ncbi:DUF5004 domain-containing protein [Mucilaginibacter sp. UR6-11]|uniref:DUF5004 domain-containing protein n=1 Tax=Mucilaginibacter sp. UR6-11 TaxID=1435644 RepID=UPI001E3A219A|nr:DUF5004 domain-containing protein [Mucilaginibacter sp. UR6-11]MCC8425812.1 DUF5004 domain-containing protein [Mucilaginibacter sp. UR6-11]